VIDPNIWSELGFVMWDWSGFGHRCWRGPTNNARLCGICCNQLCFFLLHVLWLTFKSHNALKDQTIWPHPITSKIKSFYSKLSFVMIL